MPKTAAEKAREAMNIVEPYSKSMKVLFQLAYLGLEFTNAGTLIGRAGGGEKVTYVIAPGAELNDDIVTEFDQAQSEDAKVDILVKHKILLKVLSVA